MTAGNLSNVKKSIREQVIAILSLIFAVILISIIAIPQVLQALSRLIYWRRSRNSKDVRGKFAVVTGGGSQMGRSIFLKLAQLGCNLVIVEKNLSAVEEDVVHQAKCNGVKADAFEADIKRADEVQRLVEFLKQKVDNIDFLILTSELISPGEESNEILNDNFCANLFLTLELIEPMQKQKHQGQIISISPSAGCSDLTTHQAVKIGIFNLMNSIRDHLRHENLSDKILTKCVVPWTITNAKFITRFINEFITFLPLSTNEIADEVIDGITRDDPIIEVPSSLMCLKRLIRYFYKRVKST